MTEHATAAEQIAAREQLADERAKVEKFREHMRRQHNEMFSSYAAYKRLYVDLCMGIRAIEKSLPYQDDPVKAADQRSQYRALVNFRLMWEGVCPALRTINPLEFEVRNENEN